MKKDFGNQLKNFKMKKKFNRINILISIFAIFCLFSISRSLNLLFLAYTEEYFYNLDFKIESFIENNEKYIYHYYFITFLLAVLFSLFIKKFANLKWTHYLISLIISYLLFRFFDSKIIRPFFSFFNNPRINVFTNLFVFSTFLFWAFVLIKRNNQLQEEK